MGSEENSISATIVALTASIAVIGANSLALGPIAPSISADLGVTVTATMTAAGGYGLGTAGGALWLSGHIDRLGVKRALALALAGLFAAFVASALAPGVAALVFAQAVAGIAAGVALPAIYAFAAAIAPKGRESRVLGRVIVGWTLSLVVGVVLSSLLADVVHWRAVYALLAGFTAAAWFRIARIPYHAAPPAASRRAGLGELLRFEGVVPLLAICFAYMTAFYGSYAYIGDHIHSMLEMPVRAAGLIALTYGLGFGAAVFGDPYIDRFGAHRMLPLSLLLIAGVYLGLGLAADSYVGLLAIGGLWGLVNHFGLHLIVAGLSAIDAGNRGAILGLNSAVTYLAASFGALAFGPLYAAFGFSSLACLAAAVTAAAALLAFSKAKVLQRA